VIVLAKGRGCIPGRHSTLLVISVLPWMSQCSSGWHSAPLADTVLSWLSQCSPGCHSAPLAVTVLPWLSQCSPGCHSAPLADTVLYGCHSAPLAVTVLPWLSQCSPGWNSAPLAVTVHRQRSLYGHLVVQSATCVNLWVNITARVKLRKMKSLKAARGTVIMAMGHLRSTTFWEPTGCPYSPWVFLVSHPVSSHLDQEGPQACLWTGFVEAQHWSNTEWDLKCNSVHTEDLGAIAEFNSDSTFFIQDHYWGRGRAYGLVTISIVHLHQASDPKGPELGTVPSCNTGGLPRTLGQSPSLLSSHFF
jgi:hypothetical protein